MLLMTGSAMAAGLQSNVEMNGLLTDIHNASAQWGPKLQGYARNLLFLLAGIQFVWTFGNLIWQSADVGEMFRELIKFVMTIGFFLALLTYSTEWSTAIVNSFREAGSQASGFAQELMPGDVFTLAIKLAQKVLSNISLFDLETAVVIALSGVIILLCFAFIAAFMFVTLVESYVIINAAVLFIGFGGSQWTREFAIAPLRYAVAVGAKLFVLTLIVGLIMSVSDRWFANYDGTIGPVLGVRLSVSVYPGADCGHDHRLIIWGRQCDRRHGNGGRCGGYWLGGRHHDGGRRKRGRWCCGCFGRRFWWWRWQWTGRQHQCQHGRWPAEPRSVRHAVHEQCGDHRNGNGR